MAYAPWALEYSFRPHRATAFVDHNASYKSRLDCMLTKRADFGCVDRRLILN